MIKSDFKVIEDKGFALEMGGVSDAFETPVGYAVLKRTKYFRIHDSGDFWSPEYYDQWVEICEHFSAVKFWAPTRVWHLGWGRSLPDRKPKNLILRPSALHYLDPAPRLGGKWASGSTSAADGTSCSSRTASSCSPRGTRSTMRPCGGALRRRGERRGRSGNVYVGDGGSAGERGVWQRGDTRHTQDS
jgi:hypothetical protein